MATAASSSRRSTRPCWGCGRDPPVTWPRGQAPDGAASSHLCLEDGASAGRARATVVTVEEARAVLDRLHRIDVLEREHAHPSLILAELRELVREAEAWVAAERSGTELAATALERCRQALAAEPFETMSSRRPH